MLSLVTSWVESEMRARLYGSIQIIENIGLLVAEPFLQTILAASLKLPKFASSLPFFVAAVRLSFFCLNSCSHLLRVHTH